LEARARREGVTTSQLVRDVLARFIGRGGDAWESDPVFSSKRLYRGKVPRDLSKSADDHLYGGRR